MAASNADDDKQQQQSCTENQDEAPPSPPPTEDRYTDFKLYSYWRSSSSWRVRVALAAKGIPYETCAVNLLKGDQKSDEHSQLNLMKQIPVLQCTDSATGRTVRLSQSLAIMEFLEDAFPPDRGGTLLPRDPVDRAACREMAEIVNSGTQPLQNLSVFRRIDEESKGAMSGRAFAKDAIEAGLRALEALVVVRRRRREELGGGGGGGGPPSSCCYGPYAAGTFAPTVADACIVPQMYNARRFGVDLGAVCPTLLEVERAALGHEWFRASHPDAQPDAVVAAAVAAEEPPQKKSKAG